MSQFTWFDQNTRIDNVAYICFYLLQHLMQVSQIHSSGLEIYILFKITRYLEAADGQGYDTTRLYFWDKFYLAEYKINQCRECLEPVNLGPTPTVYVKSCYASQPSTLKEESTSTVCIHVCKINASISGANYPKEHLGKNSQAKKNVEERNNKHTHRTL